MERFKELVKKTRAITALNGVFKMSKILFLIILFVVSIVLMSFHQNKTAAQKPKDVTFTGEVISVEVVKSDSNSFIIRLRVRMKLLNNSSKPIIFLKRDFLFPGIGLAQKTDDFEAGKLLARDYAGMSCSQTGKEWINLRKKLDQPTPPAEETFILMPNGEKVIDAEPVGLGVLIDPKKGFSTTEKESASWETVKSLPQLWVKIVAEPYPSWGLEPDCYGKSFGSRLQERWKDIGLLWLDDVQSEPIALDLKAAVVR